MAQQIRDIMTKNLHSVPESTLLVDVARMMRDQGVGDVLVLKDDGSLCGIITDRDIVVRVVAGARAPDRTKAGDICTGDLVELEPDASIDDAVALMREHAVRRVPVVADGKPIGIVSIGDLARVKDPRSALAQISSAAANN